MDVVSVDFSSPKKIQRWFSTTQKKQRIALIGKKQPATKNLILARKIQLAQFTNLADLEKDVYNNEEDLRSQWHSSYERSWFFYPGNAL